MLEFKLVFISKKSLKGFWVVWTQSFKGTTYEKCVYCIVDNTTLRVCKAFMLSMYSCLKKKGDPAGVATPRDRASNSNISANSNYIIFGTASEKQTEQGEELCWKSLVFVLLKQLWEIVYISAAREKYSMSYCISSFYFGSYKGCLVAFCRG